MKTRKLVMVVDRDWEFAELTARLLEQRHDVMICHSYAGALEAIAEQRFDVVIADLDLGTRATGLDLLTWVAERAPATRRVLYTRLENLRATGPNQLLLKPASATELLWAVDGGTAEFGSAGND